MVPQSQRPLSHAAVSGSMVADTCPATDTVIIRLERAFEESESLPAGWSGGSGQWAITLDMCPNLCDLAVASGDVFSLSG